MKRDLVGDYIHDEGVICPHDRAKNGGFYRIGYDWGNKLAFCKTLKKSKKLLDDWGKHEAELDERKKQC